MSKVAAVFNRPNFPIVDHYTFALGGDGCMMEGISSEAFSLAGTLGLSKLIVLYDSNRISIEGSTEIGCGCPAKQGTAAAHGEPLGEKNVEELKKNLGWDHPRESFYIPNEVCNHYEELAKTGIDAEAKWDDMFAAYSAKYPELNEQWERYHDLIDAAKILKDDEFWKYDDKPQATRNLSGIMINRIKDILPQLIGGSADLAPSNKTYMKDAGDFSAEDRGGRNLHFGVRELRLQRLHQADGTARRADEIAGDVCLDA